MYRIYDDWLDLMLYSLQREDENYLETLDGYKEKDEHHFSDAFAELQNAMSETDGDILGIVYEELGQSSDHFGQHFTPHSLSDAKAEMMLGEEHGSSDSYTVMDPAAGSGRLLMAASKVNSNGVFYGIDKDSTCAKMTALNLTFFNLDGYAIHGDSLKMDYHRIWETSQTVLGGEVRELDEEEWSSPYREAQEEESEASVATESEQVDVDFEQLRETDLDEFSEASND